MRQKAKKHRYGEEEVLNVKSLLDSSDIENFVNISHIPKQEKETI